jgi:colanic acid/amylovoran biosynthesis glycosyltransferase
MKNVVVYKTELLPISETFIQAQAGALRTYQPRYVGLRRPPNGLLLAHDAILATDGQGISSEIREKLYRLFGWGPAFHSSVRQFHPSLIHSHFATESITALPLVKQLNVPLVVTLHGSDVTVREKTLRESLGGILYLRRQEALWRRTSVFLCVSEFIRQKALEAGFPAHKLRVHYIGIDRSRFRFHSRPRGKSVVFVGRLVEKKGCASLIHAMSLVQKECPESELLIIGDGPLRQDLEQLAQALGVSARFLGSRSNHEVHSFLTSARVFSMPSVTASNGDSEGLPMVILEAQAMGLPVVSTRHAGIPEGVCDGKTGLLAQEHDHASVARHILRYLRDEEFWEQSSDAAVKWIADRFDLQKQTADLEVIYSEAIANFNPAQALTKTNCA